MTTSANNLHEEFNLIPELECRSAVWQADEAFRSWIDGEASDQRTFEILDEFITRYSQTRVANSNVHPNDPRNGETLTEERRLTLKRACNVCDAIESYDPEQGVEPVSSSSERKRRYYRELEVLGERDPEFVAELR